MKSSLFSKVETFRLTYHDPEEIQISFVAGDPFSHESSAERAGCFAGVRQTAFTRALPLTACCLVFFADQQGGERSTGQKIRCNVKAQFPIAEFCRKFFL